VQRDEARDKLPQGLAGLTRAMDGEGPYFSGDRVSAVDISLIPFAYRIDVLLGHYRKFTLPEDGEVWQRYRRWYQTMLVDPAFKVTAFDQGDYQQRLVEHYVPYSLDEGQTDVTRV